MDIFKQLIWLFILAIPIACISWTITHEEVFSEFVELCEKWQNKCTNLFSKKFFYLFTCEYCLSHYVTIVMLIITGFKMLFDDWRGYLISGFSLVWMANIYMSFFASIRVGIKSERTDIDLKEEQLEDTKNGDKKKKKDSTTHG